MVAVMLTIALCLGSCTTIKKGESTGMESESTEEQKSDSMRTEVWIRKMAGIPGSSVTLRVPVDSLLNLPSTASYSEKCRQAGAKVSRAGREILVEATCDSLAMEVDYYAMKYAEAQESRNHYQELYEQTRAVQTSSNGLRLQIGAFIAGLITGIVLTIIIRKRYGN
jgi:hypothetical protein